MALYLRFPQGKSHAFTLSYDDGVESDFRLAELMKKNGVKGTFNVNTGRFASEDFVPAPDAYSVRMTKKRFLQFAEETRDFAEIAAHGATHANLDLMESGAAVWEVISDRKELETLLGRPCRGFAYANGRFNDTAVAALEMSNFLYARTTKNVTNFALPTDPYRWACNCHHTNELLWEYTEKFLASPENGRSTPYFFSVWGHSYEFNKDNNWDLIEKFLEKIGNRENVWYCTNEEFFRYLKAWKSLEYFADQSAVYNPTATSVFLRISTTKKEPRTVEVKPGETVSLVP